MGALRYTYIGPYFVVNHIEHNEEITERKCNRSDCNKKNTIRANDIKFCPSCGGEITEHKRVNKILASINRLIDDEKMFDDLYVVHAGGTEMYNDRSVIIPRAENFNRLSDFGPRDCGYFDMDGENMTEDMEKLKQMNEQHISKASEFGFTFECKWGMVIYYF